MRGAETADLAQILPLVHGLARHHGDEPEATLDSLACDVRWGTIFLGAFVDAQIVGYAALLPLAQIQFGKRGLDMHHMFVQPAFRGMRVGRALIDAARDVALDAGCTYLMSDGRNPSGQRCRAGDLPCVRICGCAGWWAALRDENRAGYLTKSARVSPPRL